MTSASSAEKLTAFSRSGAVGSRLDYSSAVVNPPALPIDLMASFGPWRIAAYRSFAPVEQQWRALEQTAIGFPFQHFDWLNIWHEQIGRPSGADPFIVLVTDESGRPVMVLPLVIERVLGIRRLAAMGDPVCDYHGPLIAPDLATQLTPGAVRTLLDHILRLASADYVLLTRIPPQLSGGIANPFAALKLQPFSASAHRTSLGADWESFYAARRSTKTRRRFREKEKALAKLGPISFEIVTAPSERLALAAEMMALKASQLQATAGTFNTFADTHVQNFFRAVASDPAVANVYMFRLKVGNRLAAATAGLLQNSCFYYQVPVYPDGELQRYSPGNLLLHKIMAWAIDQGCTHFDFTIGDEPYKLDWCEETWILGCGAWTGTLRGRIGAGIALAEIAAKRRVKQSPKLMAGAVRLRNLLGRLRARHGS
ncbi:GNAT family N-acetyltransferase [Rhodoligotrophos defluvii]|uniref:GNAT family N-acetyltransferase n=1 Tax=Rhodoligotrophos defluvii TaxID=2561934 RepID=UPI001484F3E9|nr:GNAT family N-acetyltransferase [Rhodoligotrophos defluvii]